MITRVRCKRCRAVYTQEMLNRQNPAMRGIYFISLGHWARFLIDTHRASGCHTV